MDLTSQPNPNSNKNGNDPDHLLSSPDAIGKNTSHLRERELAQALSLLQLVASHHRTEIRNFNQIPKEERAAIEDSLRSEPDLNFELSSNPRHLKAVVLVGYFTLSLMQRSRFDFSEVEAGLVQHAARVFLNHLSKANGNVDGALNVMFPNLWVAKSLQNIPHLQLDLSATAHPLKKQGLSRTLTRAQELILELQKINEIMQDLPYLRPTDLIFQAARAHRAYLNEMGVSFRYVALIGSLHFLPIAQNLKRLERANSRRGWSKSTPVRDSESGAVIRLREEFARVAGDAMNFNFRVFIENIDLIHARGRSDSELLVNSFWKWSRKISKSGSPDQTHLERALHEYVRFSDVDLFTFGIPCCDVDKFRSLTRESVLEQEQIERLLGEEKWLQPGKVLDCKGHVTAEDLSCVGPLYTKYLEGTLRKAVSRNPENNSAGWHLAHLVYFLYSSTAIASDETASRNAQEMQLKDRELAIKRIGCLTEPQLKEFNVALKWFMRHHVFRIMHREVRGTFYSFNDFRDIHLLA
ncbi:MAG: hypothetical protein KDD42_00765 [Bdellovibrionales bacterium]|nr:hypothetical protein [Bdellovibrionales bacterium]